MAGRARKDLSNRERMFVREYLVDLNASQAAIRAGYAPKLIGSNICRVMQRPRVKAAIAAAMAERERDLQIDARAVLREIARLCFSNMLDYVRVTEDGLAELDLSEVTRDRAAAISEITLAEGAALTGRMRRGGKRVKLKLADKPRSNYLLGQHLGLFPRGRDGQGVRAEAAAGGDRTTMSDMELAQRILGILASAGEGGEGAASAPSPTPPPLKGEGHFAGDETPD
jgi:phage terminase small subunit